MDLIKSMMISASGLHAQSSRIRVISENIANANSTANVPGGDPYRRKTITFSNELDREMGLERVEVKKIGRDQSEFKKTYDPTHPAADGNGYIKMPNINVMIEMMDMRQAQRSYEANLTSIENARSMMTRTVDLLSR